MPIPKGYRRGSGGFIQPIGSVKSGAIGPTRSQIESQAKAKFEDLNTKIIKGYQTRQAQHEKIMSDIAKREVDTFKRINEALNASKESDPKDSLGNTVPSAQTKYLEQQLLGILARQNEKGKRLTPESAGIKPDELDARGHLKDTGATATPEVPATDAKVDYSQPPSVGERVEVLRGEGDTVQVTVLAPPDIHGMVKIRLQDGTVGVVPAKEINRINLEDPIPGVPPPDPSGHRRRYFENEQRRAILRDIQGGL